MNNTSIKFTYLYINIYVKEKGDIYDIYNKYVLYIDVK